MAVTWQYTEPGDDGKAVTKVVTDAEIMATFYPWWCSQMEKVGKAHFISPQTCIEDWVVVHWAWPVEEKTIEP